MKTCKHGSGRGGEKRTEKQRARRLLHQKNGVVVRQVVGHGRLVLPLNMVDNSTGLCERISGWLSPHSTVQVG